MSIEVTRVINKTITVKIDQCYNQCPYFKTEGMERQMICTHPKADVGGYFITHPDCVKGFPKDCPLFPEKAKMEKQKRDEEKKRLEDIEKMYNSLK